MEHERKQEGEPKGEREVSSLTSGKSTFDSFGTVIFLVVILEIALMFFLNLYEKNRIEKLDTQISEAQQILKQAENAAISRQIDEVIAGNELLKTVLAGKVRWSSFYGSLNAVTAKNVRLISTNLTETGSFQAEGETDSLASLAHALVAWNKGTNDTSTPFSSVSLNSNSYAEVDGKKMVSFSITGQVVTGRFK